MDVDVYQTSTPSTWNDLPDPVVSEIFSYLSHSDRLNASMVCSHWSKGFESPLLWRSIIVLFLGVPTDAHNFHIDSERRVPFLHDQNALKFSSKFGGYVQDLEIIFDPSRKNKSPSLHKRIAAFLERLMIKKCELKKLKLHGYLYGMVCDPAVREKIINTFSEFLKTQRHLEFVNIWLIYQDVRLLTTLVASSGTSLKSLIFVISFDRGSEIHKSYCEALSHLPNLEYIKLSFVAIDVKLLETLSEKCPHLRVIYIVAYSIDRFPTPISIDEEWRRIQKIRPKLKVKFDGVLPEQLSKVQELLSPSTPLISLSMNVLHHTPRVSDWSLQRVLEYVKSSFSENLVTFKFIDSVGDGWDFDLDPAIRKLITSCSKLKHLTINAKISFSTIEEICQLQMKNKIDLETFKIFYYGTCLEDRIRLKKMCSKCKAVCGNRHWDFVFKRIY